MHRICSIGFTDAALAQKVEEPRPFVGAASRSVEGPSLSVYPNPLRGQALDARSLPAGVYLVRADGAGERLSRRITVVR